MSSYFPLFIEIVWLIVLLLFIHRFSHDIWQINKVRSWHKTQATLTACHIVPLYKGRWIEVEYQFELNETQYQSRQIVIKNFFIAPFSPYCKWLAYRLAMAYKAGESVVAYYDPLCPSNSVLARPRPVKLVIITALLLFFTIFHLVLLFSRLSS